MFKHDTPTRDEFERLRTDVMRLQRDMLARTPTPTYNSEFIVQKYKNKDKLEGMTTQEIASTLYRRADNQDSPMRSALMEVAADRLVRSMLDDIRVNGT